MQLLVPNACASLIYVPLSLTCLPFVCGGDVLRKCLIGALDAVLIQHVVLCSYICTSTVANHVQATDKVGQINRANMAFGESRFIIC